MTDKEPTKNPRKKREFSKLVLGLVLSSYFIGLAIGGWVVVRLAPEQLAAYLGYIGGPTAVAIGFYAWKAKAENLVKLKQPIHLANDQGYQSNYDFNQYGRQGYGTGPYIEP